MAVEPLAVVRKRQRPASAGIPGIPQARGGRAESLVRLCDDLSATQGFEYNHDGLGCREWDRAVDQAQLSLLRARAATVRAEAWSAYGPQASDAWVVSTDDLPLRAPIARPGQTRGAVNKVAVMGHESLTELDISMLCMSREQRGCIARSRLEIAAANAKRTEAEDIAVVSTRVARVRAEAASRCLLHSVCSDARRSKMERWRVWTESRRSLRKRRAWQQSAATRMDDSNKRRVRATVWRVLNARRSRRLRARHLLQTMMLSNARVHLMGRFKALQRAVQLRLPACRALRGATRGLRSRALSAMQCEQGFNTVLRAAYWARWDRLTRKACEVRRYRHMRHKTSDALAGRVHAVQRRDRFAALLRYKTRRKRCRQRIRLAITNAMRSCNQLLTRYYQGFVLHRAWKLRMKRLRRKAKWLLAITETEMRRRGMRTWRLLIKARKRRYRQINVCGRLLMLTEHGVKRLCYTRLKEYHQLGKRRRQRLRRGELLYGTTSQAIRQRVWRVLAQYRMSRKLNKKMHLVGDVLLAGTTVRMRMRSWTLLRANMQKRRARRYRAQRVSKMRLQILQLSTRRFFSWLHTLVLCARVRRRNAVCAEGLLRIVQLAAISSRFGVWYRYSAQRRQHRAAYRAVVALQAFTKRAAHLNLWRQWRLGARAKVQERLWQTAVLKVSLSLSAQLERAVLQRYYMLLSRFVFLRQTSRKQATMALQKQSAHERSLMRLYWGKLHTAVARFRRNRHALTMSDSLHLRTETNRVARAWERMLRYNLIRGKQQRTLMQEKIQELQGKLEEALADIASVRSALTSSLALGSSSQTVAEIEVHLRLSISWDESGQWTDLLLLMNRYLVHVAGMEKKDTAAVEALLQEQRRRQSLIDLEEHEIISRRALATSLASDLSEHLESVYGSQVIPSPIVAPESPASPTPPTPLHEVSIPNRSPRTAASLYPLPEPGPDWWTTMFQIYDWVRTRGRAILSATRKTKSQAAEAEGRQKVGEEEDKERGALLARGKDELKLRWRLARQSMTITALQDHALAVASPETLRKLDKLVAEEARVRPRISTEWMRRLRLMRRLLLRLEKPFGLAGGIGLACDSEDTEVAGGCQGAVVKEVMPGGPAARGGVVGGDVIVAVRNPMGMSVINTRKDLHRAAGPE
eukprot:Hpha_TRINITY_DN17155_c0_g1::TRINITY_DN17155_c0_g1_i1::g.146881::m.146881